MAPRPSSPTVVLRTRLLSAAIASCFASVAYGLPVAPTVVNGTANFSQSGNVLTVTNSNDAIINWNTFSIGAGETTRFIQSSSSSQVLNRVLSNNPSLIYGTLSSNGRVWLVNPAGILVGAGGVVDTAGFVASTLPVRNQDFLAGKLTFGSSATTGSGSVVNQGTITTAEGGSVYLIGAASVENRGLIQTPKGETVLAAGQTVHLIDTGSPGVKVEITGNGSSTNLGQIVADAGRIGLVGSLVKNSGTLNASSVVNEGGRIFLRASQDAYVDGDGRIVTTGTKGGQVEVLGNRVAVMDNASIDASGTTGGGTILVGGDYQGKNPDIPNSQVTYFGPKASIKANASDKGDGGKVIVWADDTTRAYGSIEAKGGANSGNGGFVETSGHKYLDFHALVDTSASRGVAGTLLLDPEEIQIYAGSGSDAYGYYGSGGYGGGNWFYDSTNNIQSFLAYNSGTSTSVVYGDNIGYLLQHGNVTLQTSGLASGTGDITFNGGTYSWSGTYSLSLLAYGGTANGTHTGNINFNGASITTGGALLAIAGWNGATASAVAGNGNIIFTDSVVSSTGAMGLYAGNNISLTSASGPTRIASSGTMTVSAGGALTLQGGSSGNGNYASLASYGGQTITAASISVQGGSSGHTNYAEITNYSGNQAVSANAITLRGGGSGSGDHNDWASIENQSSAYGTQTITITGTNGSIAAYGGAGGQGVGSSSANAHYDSSCYGSGVGTGYCYSSHNSAGIHNISYGGQTVHFADSGGSINLVGGSNGFDNRATIQNESPDWGTTAAGLQRIYGGPSITLTGGSGGKLVVDTVHNKAYDFRNSANIDSGGNISIDAGTITLNGGTSGMAGALIGGGPDSGGGTITITSAGGITLNGGSGSLVTATNNSSSYALGTAVAIGSDDNVTVSLTTTSGGITLNGGSGSGGRALIGSLDGTGTVYLSSAGAMTSTGNTGGVYVGSLNSSSPGAVTLASSGGNINFDAASSIRAGTLSATSSTGSLNLSSVEATALTASAYGALAITDTTTGSSLSDLTVNSLSSSSGDIALTTSQRDIVLAGNVTGTAAITLRSGGDLTQSSGSISNGSTSGTHDVSLYGGDITLRSLTSQRGAILNATGSISLLGSNSSYYIDDDYFTYNLPFSFAFFGTSYSQAYISTNGLITFGAGVTTYTDSVSGLGLYKAIAPAWNDWMLQPGSGRDIYITRPSSSSLAVQWNVVRFADTSKYANFEAVLNQSGAIRFNYGTANASFSGDVTIGLSNGTTASTLASGLMSLGSFSLNNLASTTFTPNGSGGYTETVAASNTSLQSNSGATLGSTAFVLKYASSTYYSAGTAISALGSVVLSAGGSITAPGAIYGTSLTSSSTTGAQFSGLNHVSSFAGSNSGTGEIELVNVSAPLTLGSISNQGGDIGIFNQGEVIVSGTISAPAGAVGIAAYSPLTINSGASITAYDEIALIAGGSLSTSTVSSTDVLTINGAVTSSHANIGLYGAAGVTVGSTARISALSGSIYVVSPYGDITVDPLATLLAPSIFSNGEIYIPTTTIDDSLDAVSGSALHEIVSAANQDATDLTGQTVVVVTASTNNGSPSSSSSSTVGGTSGTFGSSSESSEDSSESAHSSASSSSSTKTTAKKASVCS